MIITQLINVNHFLNENILSAQTDKTDDNRYDLEAKSNKLQKEIDELKGRIQSIKGKEIVKYKLSTSYK